MRTIKFRAWHEKLQKMFSAEEMAADQLTILPTGKFINVSGVSTNMSVIYDCMIPLQYTGLKDKNGIEIYEGDVLNSNGNVVEFSYGSFNINGDRPVYASNSQVIGNIYEHPELCKIETTITQ